MFRLSTFLVKEICRVGGVAECLNSNVAVKKLAGLKSCSKKKDKKNT